MQINNVGMTNFQGLIKVKAEEINGVGPESELRSKFINTDGMTVIPYGDKQTKVYSGGHAYKMDFPYKYVLEAYQKASQSPSDIVQIYSPELYRYRVEKVNLEDLK